MTDVQFWDTLVAEAKTRGWVISVPDDNQVPGLIIGTEKYVRSVLEWRPTIEVKVVPDLTPSTN